MHNSTLRNTRGGLNLDDMIGPTDLNILQWKLDQARARQQQDTPNQIEAGEEAEYQVFKALMRICDTDQAHIAVGVEVETELPF